MSLGVNEESHFHSLARALSREDWLTDARFRERAERKVHAPELVAELEKELARKTAKEWEPILQSAGVPCARLRTLPEALSSPQVEQRGFVQELPDGVSVPTLPFRLGNAVAYSPSSPAPALGEQGDEVKRWLQQAKS